MALMQRWRGLVTTALFLSVSGRVLAGLSPYVVVPLPESTVQAGPINDAGRFLFRADGGLPSLWERGVIVPLAGAPDIFLTTALNNRNQVVGAIVDTTGGASKIKLHPGLSTFSSGFIQLPGVTSGLPLALNDSGVAAGAAGFDNPIKTFEAFTHDASGYHHLGFAKGDNASVAFSLNNAGSVVGTSGTANGVGLGFGDSLKTARATVWSSGGKISVIGGLPGDTQSAAISINNHGDIVGVSGNTAGGLELLSTGPTHAFLDHNGVVKSLGSLGGTLTTPSSINDSGQIVGSATTAGGNNRGFIYQNNKIQDLNKLIYPASGLTVTGAVAINKDGVIVAGTLSADGSIEGNAVLFPRALYGSSQRYPVLSDLPNFGQSGNDVFDNAQSGQWFVEPTASSIQYQSDGVSFFTSITLPTTGFSRPMAVEVAGKKLGYFAPGSTINFEKMFGQAVDAFTVDHILPQSAEIEGRAFAVDLSFSSPEAGFFVADRAAAVPLPSAATAFPIGAVLAMLTGGYVRRRQGRGT